MAVDLQESRKKINAIDAQIARLFEERMQVSTDVARYKMETGKPIFDPDRERQVIERIKERFPYRDEEFRGALAVLFQTIMDLGKEHQKREMARISEPKVAYFGLPGACGCQPFPVHPGDLPGGGRGEGALRCRSHRKLDDRNHTGCI